MSLTPETTPSSEAARGPGPPVPVVRGTQVSRLRRGVWVVLFAIFALEIGCFLVVFPWMDSWTFNHLPSLFPGHEVDLQDLWDDPYFRSAISALGFLNVYIALHEMVQLIRRSKQT